MAAYDDLIPAAPVGGNAYADLIPKELTPEEAAKPFIGFRKPAKAAAPLEAVKTEAEKERAAPKFNYDELYTNPELFKIVQDTSKLKGRDYKEGQDKQAFVANFMSDMRGEEWNTFSTIAALNKLKNAPMADAEKLALGKKLFENVQSAGEKGGQPGAAPYFDIAKSALTDLTNYIGFGVGTAMKKAAATKATTAAGKAVLGEAGEAAVKSKIAELMARTSAAVDVGKAAMITPKGIVGTTTATEAVIGAGQSVASQKLGQATATAMGETPQDLEPWQIGISAVMGAAGGYFEGKGALAMKPGESGAEQFSEKLLKAKLPKDPNAPVTPLERLVADPVAQNMDEVVSQFNKQEGRRIVDDIDPISAITDAKVQTDLSARAVRVAMHVIDADPTFRVKPNQKTSDAISEVFSNLDNINDAVLEQAIRKEGLSPEQFAQANLMTVSDAAKVMQQYSAASKILNRMTQIDPEVGKLVDSLFNKPDEYVSALGRVGQVVSTVERESKAFVVSTIGTTVRNVLGTSTGLLYNSAASLIEGALYTVGRTLDGAASGKRIETAKNSLGDTFRDAFSVYGYMAKSGLSNEVTNNLLQHNPALRNNLLGATQESSTGELSKAAQVFNTLNVAQDAFFRKAIFNAAVEKHMRRAGLDMYQVIGEGKNIPASVLQQAGDETLKATFSYTPKMPKKGIETFEAGAEAAGNLFVKAAEFPGGSLVATFPRFMSNAIAFQYRYSVFGAASGAEDLLRGAMMNAGGSSAGNALIRTGQENIAKGVVGTAALAAAYDYRLNNQDTDWYNIQEKDGTTVDTRALFPLGPTLAVADFLAKRKLDLEPKTAEAIEAIIGMKMPAGTQSQFLDQVFAAFSSERDADKAEVAIGKVLGDFTARFTQPFMFKSAYEFLDLFREGGAVQRDPNVITTESDVLGAKGLEAGIKRVQAKLPIIKEQLPEAIPRLREGPVYKEGEFFYSLIGVREAPPKTVAEKEVVKLGLDPYKLYGPSSGDREFDRSFVEKANPAVSEAISRTVTMPDYQKLSNTDKAIRLTSIVRESSKLARELAGAEMMGEDYNRVQKMRFNKMPDMERKSINDRYAKEHAGKTLEQANDYKALDEYEVKALAPLKTGFAIGGFLGKKLAGGIAKSVPTTGLASKAATQVDSAAIDAIIKKNLAAPITPAAPAAPVMKATKPVPTEPLPTPSAAPVERQMEEAIPTQPEMAMEAPTPSMPSVAEEAMPVVTGGKYSAGFSPEDYAVGEKAMAEQFQPEFLKGWKIANPEDYMDAVHNATAAELNVKWSDMPKSPFKKVDESAASLADEVEYDAEGNPISSAVETKTTKPFVPKEYGDAEELGTFAGDLNDKVGRTATSKRKAMLSQIKEKREDSFAKLRSNPKAQKFDDEVLGVMLGEYRAANKMELSPNNPQQLGEGIALAEKLQSKLDMLREKYKDVPPMRLYHGNTSESIEAVKKSGFSDPQKASFRHEEMSIGAPSFTKDLNLGFSSTGFGGRSPSNYVYTDIPYADYVFGRINMKPENYDVKDMNTFARAITGAPDVVRPVSLPRAGFNETEDMMIEAEKLFVRGKYAKLKPAEADVTKAMEKVKPGAEIKKDEELIKSYLTEAKKASVEAKDKEAVKLAYMSYTALRQLMNDYMKMSAGAIRAGTGQQYQSRLDTMIDLRGINQKLPEVAAILNRAGSKQKAQNMLDLHDKLTTFSQTAPGYPSSAKQETQRKESLQQIRELTPKLAKGGLASRR